MSLPRYLEYKDSGVEWLGEVPVHWVTKPLKKIAKLVTGLTPPTENPENYAEAGFPWIRPEDIDETGQSTCASKYLSPLGAKQIRPIAPGASLICCIGTIGKVGIVDGMGSTNQQITSAVFSDGAKYGFYAVSAARAEFEISATGNVLRILNSERLGSIEFPQPPLNEQTAIAAFLDRETAKIDGLIAEQEKLITLLAEKRQATISHTVTKGLNPAAPMKDSGVVWLGEVPAHWEIKSIRHILDAIGDVDHFMPASVEKGIPYLMTGDLKEFVSQVSLDDCKQISHNDYFELSKKIKSAKGDVIMARYATIGTLMYVDVDVDFLVSYSCVTLKTNHSEVSGLYLFQYMKSDAFRQGIENQINTNTQSNVGIKDLQSVKIVAPPIKEQADIATFLDTETARLDELTAAATRGIALLKERRSALISAAVTGKIDVRAANNQ